MQLNKICLSAIILFILFAILKLAIKVSWSLFLLGIIICIALGIFGFFKGDDF